MKRDIKTRTRTAVMYLLALQIMISAGVVSFDVVHAIESDSGPSIASSRASDVLKILSVLDNRISEQSLLEKAKNKIITLSDQQTRLIASLAEHAGEESNSTGGDIAFLLITALIILL